jgi:hypothetical protein
MRELWELSAPEYIRLIALNLFGNVGDRSRCNQVEDMPATVAVRPIERPYTSCRGELHSRNALPCPVRTEVLSPRWPAFEDRYRISANVHFDSDLILKICWNDLFGVLANLLHIEIGDASHAQNIMHQGI